MNKALVAGRRSSRMRGCADVAVTAKMSVNTPDEHSILVGAGEAAHAVGWTMIPIVCDPSTPTGLPDAFAQVIADNPDGAANGSEDMWDAYPLFGMGWKSIDALARYYSKESAGIDSSAPTPFRILASTNVPSLAALPEVADYQASFTNLWHVSAVG